MLSPFKTIGVILCLGLALCFAAPASRADSFTYTFTISSEFGLSLTTAAIAAVTMQTAIPAVDLTATSTSGALAGCMISSVILDAEGVGATQIDFTGCGFGSGFSPDGFTLGDYSTQGTYTIGNDTLVVTAVPTATPEPGSLALMLAGVGLVFAMRKIFS